MSIRGRVVTALWPGGTPGAPMGLLYRRIVIPLTFDLHVAGLDSTDFVEVLPAQSFQNANAGIQLVVVVVDQAGDAVNIGAATVLTLRLKRPDGRAFSRAASLLTNGMDGAVQYTSTETDFIMDGTWAVQAYFVLAGDKKSTRWGAFTVNPNILSE